MKIKISNALSVKIACMLLFLGLMGTAAVPAHAAKIPTKMRGYVKGVADYRLELPEYGDTIKNVKSKSKQLMVKYTGNYQNKSTYSQYNSKEATIMVYAKKAGTYKFTYQIVSAKKKVTKKTVTVYVGVKPAIKSVTFGGKKILYDVTAKKSGVFKVTMNPGNKLKKIRVTTVEKNEKTSSGDSTTIQSKETTKTIKNGSKLTLGTKGSYYCYEYKSSYGDYYSYNMSTDILAYTRIEVTYYDKYTGQNEEVSYSLRRLW